MSNIGPRAGAEIAQLYVHQNAPALPRPDKELKGFEKVFLKPGETKTVSIPLPAGAFAYYDPARHGWVAEQGEYRILVGSSSRDVKLQSSYRREITAMIKQ